MRKLILLIIITLSIGLYAGASPDKDKIPGSERFPYLDNYARETPRKAEASLQSLVEWLMKEANSEIEKARLIFTWIASNVRYDDHGFNTGNYSGTSASEVLSNRVAVCHGYSELFTEMCRIAGLKAETISGYAKGITYRPGERFDETNHSWNAAIIDNEWRLFDVTWGAGYGKGVNGRLVTVMEFEDYWFCASPEEAIFTHFPQEEKWQFNSPRISLSRFEKMPYVPASFFKMGFSGEICFPGVLDGTIESLPKAYSIKEDIQLLEMPYSGTLSEGKTISLKIRAGEGIVPAYTNGGYIKQMNKSGEEYSASFSLLPGDFSILINTGKPDMTYDVVVEYIVD
jgi:hypothetical protein